MFKEEDDESVGSVGDEDGSKSRSGLLPRRFLTSTFDMVDDKANAAYVGWNAEGDTLVIRHLHEFAETVLPKYFKHKKASSFIRQLNMYGFNRVMSEENSFKHPLFRRGHQENLPLIKRKVSKSKTGDVAHAAAETEKLVKDQRRELEGLLATVESMKTKQAELDEQVFELRAKNEHLDSENFKLWEVMSETKKRHQMMVRKMRDMVKMLAYLYQQDHIQRLEVAKKMPQLLTSSEQLLSEHEAAQQADPLEAPAVALFPSTSLADPLDSAALLENEPALDAGGAAGLRGGDDLVRLDSLRLPSLMATSPISFPHDSAETSLVPAAAGALVPWHAGGGRAPTGGSGAPTSVVAAAASAAGVPTGAATQSNDLVRADSLVRGVSLQSFLDLDQPYVAKYPAIVRGVTELVADQDDAFRRMLSLSSTLSDQPPALPFDDETAGASLDDDEIPPLQPQSQTGNDAGAKRAGAHQLHADGKRLKR
jgi:hypothetical protein